MLQILRKSFSTGVVTTRYPETPAEVSGQARGRPEIDFANWKDARPGAAICPTGAIAFAEGNGERTATLDLGKCIFCGLCAEVDPAIRMTNQCELAARSSGDLKFTAKYQLNADGTHKALVASPSPLNGERVGVRGEIDARRGISPSPHPTLSPPSGRGEGSSAHREFEATGRELQARIHKVLGRSLHIREVDAGSCNGCEIEIVGLNSPVYDIERFGIHFVASPRHADMLLVTGPVTRNMELALRKTYDAMPAPRLVVAVGACGCSGGIFGQNYASLGGVDRVLPVDVYIPGCPPNPHALLHGILLALGRLDGR